MRRRVNRTARGWVSFDNWIYKKLGITSGGQLRKDEKLYIKYRLAVLKEAHKYGYNWSRVVPDKVMFQLEDENFHTLTKALTELMLTTPSWRAESTEE